MKKMKALDKVLNDIDRLKRRSVLLDQILKYYKIETQTFEIPKEWANNNVLPSKLPAINPRQLMEDRIKDVLTWEEQGDINIY